METFCIAFLTHGKIQKCLTLLQNVFLQMRYLQAESQI